MTQEQKANLYGQLLNEHTRLSNKVSSIKGENLELSKKQLDEIREIQNQQLSIMNKLRSLMS